MVRGFAPMICKVIRTKRMPPWHAGPHVGTWKGDRSLSVDQVQTLTHWIEAGAALGEGPDPLVVANTRVTEWPLAEPNLIVEIPASGIVDYNFPVVKKPTRP